MGLFTSDSHTLVSYYAFRFVAAGTYHYEDTANSARATVTIPTTVKPAAGTPATTFTITWAAAAPPPGYTFDVQIRRPSTGYTDWQPSVTTTHASFVPDAGAGTYTFRARLRNTANNAASGYSPPKSIRIA